MAVYLYGLVGLNDIKTVEAYISTNIKWNESIFGSNCAKISCQITVNSEDLEIFIFKTPTLRKPFSY